MVEEEVVEFVWTHKVFGNLLDFTGFGCREKFRTDRCVYDVHQDGLHLEESVVGNPLDHAADHCFRNTGIEAVHRHMVSVVCGPAKCELREVACSDHYSSGLVCDVHQDLCPFSRLRILISCVVDCRVVLYVRKMLVAGCCNRDFTRGDAEGVHQFGRVALGARCGAVTRHCDTDDPFS